MHTHTTVEEGHKGKGCSEVKGTRWVGWEWGTQEKGFIVVSVGRNL